MRWVSPVRIVRNAVGVLLDCTTLKSSLAGVCMTLKGSPTSTALLTFFNLV